MRIGICALGFAIGGLALPSAVLAQRADDTFYARGGVFFSKVDSSLKLDGNNGSLGTDIDFEGDLSLDRHDTQPFGLIGWRFSSDWRVEAEYFSLSRSGNAVIDRQIVVGDTVYEVGADVGAGLTTSVYRMGFGYSFVNNEQAEVGVRLGAHLTNFKVFVEGVGSVNGNTAALNREERRQLVPLPTLGIYGRYDISKTFAIVGRIDYFTLKIDDYKGELIDISGGVTARVTKNIGIGADYRYVDYKLRATANDFTGQVNYKFHGPFVYIELGF